MFHVILDIVLGSRFPTSRLGPSCSTLSSWLRQLRILRSGPVETEFLRNRRYIRLRNVLTACSNRSHPPIRPRAFRALVTSPVLPKLRMRRLLEWRRRRRFRVDLVESSTERFSASWTLQVSSTTAHSGPTANIRGLPSERLSGSGELSLPSLGATPPSWRIPSPTDSPFLFWSARYRRFRSSQFLGGHLPEEFRLSHPLTGVWIGHVREAR